VSEKVRENRARRAASRQGLALTKSRRRDPRAIDHGLYWLHSADCTLVSPEQGVTLDEIETILDRPANRRLTDVS
jgi:hypothetical protein